MLLKGRVTAEWERTGNGRRARVYSLTDAGRAQLHAEVDEFERVVAAVTRVVHPAAEEV
jgi:DNA-binding PadR family transcriptional regulator